MNRLEPPRISILTGGRDPHYAMGLLWGLLGTPLTIDFVANRAMRGEQDGRRGAVRYVDLYPSTDATGLRRVAAIIRTYVALVRYVAWTRNPIIHILWYYKFEVLDNTVLAWLYRALGKRVVLTVHNVNRGERDGTDGALNRWSLRYLYRAVDHIFVHTLQSKTQLCRDFLVDEDKVTVIPFGVNIFTTQSQLDPAAARQRLGFGPGEKVILFFGNIAPYKGIDTLVDALALIPDVRLMIAGPVKKGCEAYWGDVERAVARNGLNERVRINVEFIPESDVELYFKAADVTVLPYKKISQSGVLFLSLGFGVPVIVSDADGLPESVDEGVNGLIFREGDPEDLARRIAEYFSSQMFTALDVNRHQIIEELRRRHSWDSVAETTYDAYGQLLTDRRVPNAAAVR